MGQTEIIIENLKINLLIKPVLFKITFLLL